MCDLEFSKMRQFFKQFIRLYESFPCLWDLRSKKYHDRELRAKAYNVLVKKLQEIQPGADRLAVVRKINCFRSNLRKEKKKILDGIKTGRVVKPKLWYHQHFEFLNGIGRKAEDDTRKSSVEIAENVNIQNRPSVEHIKIEDQTSDLDSIEYNRDGNIPQDLATEELQPPYDVESLPTHPTSLADSNYNSVTGSYRIRDQDRHDVFGNNVAMKLRHISSTNDIQRIMAEKIINEALSFAEMGLLTMEHCKVLK